MTTWSRAKEKSFMYACFTTSQPSNCLSIFTGGCNFEGSDLLVKGVCPTLGLLAATTHEMRRTQLEEDCPHGLSQKIWDATVQKRSIDLVRQAQFAACSYLGFDPYEEKHKNGVAHQVTTSDGTVPLELHLHHHHHHHCRETEEVLKRPPHMSASADTPLGVGSLLSICDHIQMFQDAWQGHGRVDERSQKFMLQGSLMKRESSFAGFEGGSPLNDDRREKLRERDFSDRFCNEGIMNASPMTPPMVAGLDDHQVNTAARISHWECSVVQEEKLTKGIRVRGRPMDASDLLTKSSDFGWTPVSKPTSSTRSTKLEHGFLSHSADANISSVRSSQDSFSGSNKKSSSVATKRKKSFSDMDLENDQMYLGASDTSARPCMVTKAVNHACPLQVGCTGSKKVAGLSLINLEGQLPTHGFDAQGGEIVMPKPELISLHRDRVDGLLPKQSTVVNCDECTCQRSLPTPRPLSSWEEKQDGMGIHTSVHGLFKDFRRDFDSPNAISKQYDLSEKIISLDNSKVEDAHSPQFVRNRQGKGSSKQQNPVSLGKDIVSLASSHAKVLDYNADIVRDDTRGNRGQHLNAVAKGIERLLPKDAQGLFQHGFCADKEKATQDLKPISTNTRSTNLAKDSEHEFSTSQKVQSKMVVLPTKKLSPAEAGQDNRLDKSCFLAKVEDGELLNQINIETVGNSDGCIQAAETRLLQLLDERTKLHLKFDAELEQKEAERVQLHSLFERERSKSEAAKKELQDMKEKFASLIMRAPLAPNINKHDDLHDVFVSPRHFHKLSDTLEERDVFEKREEPSKRGTISECGSKVQKRADMVEDAMTERSYLFKNGETCILQQVRQHEMQLKTAEDAFQELEKRLRHVEPDKMLLKECLSSVQGHHKDVKVTEKSTQTSTWNDGVFEKYSSVYQCPVFEHSHSKTKSRKCHDDASETDSDERGSSRKEQIEDQTDMEIRQLTEELKMIGADMQSGHKVLDSKENFSSRLEDLIQAETCHDKDMNEGEATNQMLRKRQTDKSFQLNKFLTQHAKELEKIQSSSSKAHHLNKELASNLANSETKLSELQVHYDGLLASVESQLKEAKEDVQDLQKTADLLRHALSENEKKMMELKEATANNEAEITNLRKIEEEAKTERDAIEREKADLSVKLQEARKEASEQATRVTEYLSINEELLDFAQKKENEVASPKQQLQALQQQIFEKASADGKLQADYEKVQKELNDVQKAYYATESENGLLKTKLSDNNLQLLQQEGTIATLTKQMADIMQGRDSMLEEAAQFHGFLQSAKYKEFELENKLGESSSHAKDLEDRLHSMESEILKSQAELADLKKQNSGLQKAVEEKELGAIGMRKTVNDLRKKVQDLEEEVMLKEGQIAIISSQNRESYEPF